jgi:hypothetical protein
MSNLTVLFIIAGGLSLGMAIALVWYGRSRFKRPKVKGQKRQYMTNGEYLINRLKIWIVNKRGER